MDTAAGVNTLKRYIFYEFLNLIGRVYILVRHSDNVVLGDRGFLDDEKEKGLILVFNTRIPLTWDEYGITATLVFGTSPQRCFIPADDVVAVYSPELNAQFITSPFQEYTRQSVKRAGAGVPDEGSPDRPGSKALHQSKVVSVDFKKKKKL